MFHVNLQGCTGWWLQPIWKIFVKMGIFPNFRGEIKHIKSVFFFKNATYFFSCRSLEKFYHVCFPTKKHPTTQPQPSQQPPFFPVFGWYHLLHQPTATFDLSKTQGASQTVHKESVALESLPIKLPKFSQKKIGKDLGIFPSGLSSYDLIGKKPSLKRMLGTRFLSYWGPAYFPGDIS